MSNPEIHLEETKNNEEKKDNNREEVKSVDEGVVSGRQIMGK